MKKSLIDHLQGKPSAVRWVAAVVLVWPIYAVRYALIGVLICLWLYHAPRVAMLTWSTVTNVEHYPNKKRTPKKSQPWQKLDDFDDVRVRVSELTQYPKQ